MTNLYSRLRKIAVLGLLTIATPHHLTAAGQGETAKQASPRERSIALTVTINGASRQLSAGDLSAMPQTRVTVHNSHNNRDEVYTGVAVYDLLSANGLPLTKETQLRYGRSYLRAQGTDFYFAIYSATEVTPDLNQSSVIVATHVDGRDLGGEGLFKLVCTGDKRPARWVRNLTSITFTTIN